MVIPQTATRTRMAWRLSDGAKRWPSRSCLVALHRASALCTTTPLLCRPSPRDGCECGQREHYRVHHGLIKKGFNLATCACPFDADTLRGGTGEIRAWITVARAILE